MKMMRMELPPPRSFETTYASYRAEWDAHFKKKSSLLSQQSFLSSDVTIMDLQWHHFQRHHRDKEQQQQQQNLLFLFGCTSTGEIVVWRVITKQKPMVEADSDVPTEAAATTATRQVTRFRVSSSPQVLHTLQVLETTARTSITTTTTTTTTSETSNNKKRKRSSTEIKEMQRDQSRLVLLVAGSDGIWSISMNEILSSVLLDGSNNTPQEIPKPVVTQIHDQPVVHMVLHQHQQQQQQQRFLYVLETDQLLQFDLAMTMDDVCHGVIMNRRLSLSSYLKNRSQRQRHHYRHHQYQQQQQQQKLQQPHNQEMCTTMLVSDSCFHGSNTDGTVATTVVIGTNQSRLLVIRLKHDDDVSVSSTDLSLLEDPPRSLSLVDNDNEEHTTHDDLSSSSRTSNSNSISTTTKPSWPSFGDNNNINNNNNPVPDTTKTTSPWWSVSQIIQTQQGTWWTVVANRTTTTTASSTRRRNPFGSHNNNNNNSNHTNRSQHRDTNTGGLIATWHAPSGTLVTSQETSEAIRRVANIVMNGQSILYTVANHQAVTLRKSPFRLEKSGRLWSTPPSGYAIAATAAAYTMAATPNEEDRYDGSIGGKPETIPQETIPSPAMMVAVAGVGNQVDVFVDHCRIQILTMH